MKSKTKHFSIGEAGAATRRFGTGGAGAPEVSKKTIRDRNYAKIPLTLVYMQCKT